MPSIEIVQAGWMTSVQDMGRKGLAYYAVPVSGVMDYSSASQALCLLGLPLEAPILEFTGFAPSIRFHQVTQIAITGANFDWTINEKPIARNQVTVVATGSLLRGKFARNGWRGYLAIQGKWNIERTYNSYATYTNARIGGIQGRLLRQGDLIHWQHAPSIEQVKSVVPLDLEQQIIPLKPGPEYDYLTGTSKNILTTNSYRISADSNRMGARLEGTPLTSNQQQLKYSLPVLPGFIQLPASGLPIVILQDGQTTGGYPRIAYIQEQYLSVFNQIPLGATVQFRWSLK